MKIGRKEACRRVTKTALRSGFLAWGDTCERCGACHNIHVHHPDYERPLDIEWLCASCHMKHHGMERRGKPIRRTQAGVPSSMDPAGAVDNHAPEPEADSRCCKCNGTGEVYAGEDLRSYRIERGISAASVARVLGVSRQRLHQIETRGEVTDRSFGEAYAEACR